MRCPVVTKANAGRNAEWARLYTEEGLSVYEIGERYGVHGGTVWWNLKQMGVPRRPIPEHVKNEEYRRYHKEWADLYLQGLDAYEIAGRYGAGSVTVYRALEAQGIERRPQTEVQRKHRVGNDRGFQTIDTDAKAYWLGFLMADGNVTTRAGLDKPDLLQVSLSAVDRQHLLNLAAFLDTDDSTVEVKRTNAVALHRSSANLVADLMACGCVPRKSLTLEFPHHCVPTHLMGAFVRGYFDGDGSVFQTTYKRSKGVRVAWCSGSEAFLTDLEKAVMEQTGVLRMSGSTRKGGNLHQKTVERRKDVWAIYGWLYTDATIYLPRKKAKFEELLGLNQSTENSA